MAIDTQKIQAAPRCISGIAEVAATLARADTDHLTHAVEITTCFPLDVETVGHMTQGLSERPGIDHIQASGISYLYIERPDDYNLRQLDLNEREHLDSNTSLIKHLSELRANTQWVRKVREHHDLLRVVAASSMSRFELSYFTSRLDIPSARIQSTLNDLGASGFIHIDLDEEAQKIYYVFPEFDYPKARYSANMNLLDNLVPREPSSPSYWLVAALLIAIITVSLALLIHL